MWTANKKEIGAYDMSLQQIDNDVIIPRSGWKCAKCDKTENLWLNLTDGMIPYRRLSEKRAALCLKGEPSEF